MADFASAQKKTQTKAVIIPLFDSHRKQLMVH
jgi:hypothetical protein